MESLIDEVNEEVLIDGEEEDIIFSFERPHDNYQWYVLYATITKEFKVRDRILRTAEAKANVKQIILPTVPKTVFLKNKKTIKREIVLSGYLFIFCNFTEALCETIYGVEDVFYFLGGLRHSNDFSFPNYLTLDELVRLENGLNRMKDRVGKPENKYHIGDYVCIINGIFKNLKGYIKEIRNDYAVLDLEDDLISKKININTSDIENIN